MRDVLGVDDYINRTYVNAAAQPVESLHRVLRKPAPGGHDPLPAELPAGRRLAARRGGRTALDVDGRRLTVNRYVIQKGLDRQVVLYWYQGRGRVVANEYANKFWLMLDAARLHRSDGALVRVVAPVMRSANGSLAAADGAAAEFTRTIFPRLSGFLP